jgi:hypothetical protein
MAHTAIGGRQSERDTGVPRGAGRALFRLIAEAPKIARGALDA